MRDLNLWFPHKKERIGENSVSILKSYTLLCTQSLNLNEWTSWTNAHNIQYHATQFSFTSILWTFQLLSTHSNSGRRHQPWVHSTGKLLLLFGILRHRTFSCRKGKRRDGHKKGVIKKGSRVCLKPVE